MCMTVLGVGHSHITLMLLSSVSIPPSEILCPKYVSDFLKSHTYWLLLLVLLLLVS